MRPFFILFFAFTLTCVASAQDGMFGASEISKASTIHFYGLDFSEARFIGPEGFNNPQAIKDDFFYRWNQLMKNESKKYNIAEAFHKKEVEYDFSVVKERNKMPDPETMVIDTDYSFTKEKVAEMVTGYEGGEASEGLGLVFIVESFNKSKEKASIWVTFFDIGSKNVVETKRYTGDPGGFGIRNYWAGAIHEIIEEVTKDYEKWLKKRKK